jgi:hypothetical protein
MKNSNKIAEKSEKNRGGGWCSLLVMMFGVLPSGSSAYFQIWKVRLCQIKNGIKIGKKSGKKGGEWCSLLVMMFGGATFRV